MHLKKKVSTLASIFIVGLAFNVGCSSNEKSGSNVEASSDEVMENLNARKAIAMAVDKDNFVDVILNNGSTSANYFIPKNLALDENQKDFRDTVKDVGYTHDDEKAKEEWEKAKKEIGFDKVTLEMVLSDTEMNRKLGEYVQSELSILE
ncbi:peptide ABC transporter substrate-binding protein, partial [Turicibacter sanguinis]|nr:peptide ABC transporter substrate-binding protein [Turicibacter sanguinis]